MAGVLPVQFPGALYLVISRGALCEDSFEDDKDRWRANMQTTQIQVLVFDVFGTVVDWRGGVTREGEAFAARHTITGIDWEAFAQDWRALYQPAMERVRSGELPFTRLDVLHRWNLDELLKRYSIGGISEDDIEDFNRAWHRLDPWPDVLDGL